MPYQPNPVTQCVILIGPSLRTTVSEHSLISIIIAHFSVDVKPLKDFTASIQQAHARRTQPSRTQTSPLSPLQLLAKGAKKAIIMPVLEALDLSFDPPPLSPIPVDIAASQKALERAKIMDIKNRQLFGGSSLTIRKSEPDGVYMRLDLEDESGVVDVDMSAEQNPFPSVQRTTAVIENGNESAELGPLIASGSSVKTTNGRLARGTNARKKKRENSPSTSPSIRKMNLAHDGSESDVAFGTPMENTSLAGDEAATGPSAAPIGKKVKPKPATYKLAWSVEEQHLLEQLLEKFPSGSKNRSVFILIYLFYCCLFGEADGYKSQRQ